MFGPNRKCRSTVFRLSCSRPIEILSLDSSGINTCETNINTLNINNDGKKENLHPTKILWAQNPNFP